MQENGDEIRMLSEEIMQYLDKHPHAADSLEGVARWWLRRETTGRMDGGLQAAMDQLVSKGLIAVSVLPDGTRIYKRRI